MRRSAYHTLRHVVNGETYEIAWLGGKGRVKVYSRSPMGTLRSAPRSVAAAVLRHYERDRERKRYHAEQSAREESAALRAQLRAAEREWSRWHRRLWRYVLALCRRILLLRGGHVEGSLR